MVAPIRHAHIRDARPSCKEEPPSAADRAVMQAAWDEEADVLVSADRHITESGFQGVARAAGRVLRVERPDEFARRRLAAIHARRSATLTSWKPASSASPASRPA